MSNESRGVGSKSILANLRNEEDTFKILLCSDTHLGSEEKNGDRGKDSFEAFEEVLRTARDRKVDFVLHGGDLFDSSKPSPGTWFETMRTVRSFCLGDLEVNFEFLSDPAKNFPRSGRVNYEDPNFNIGIPFFAIHGNHDGRTGATQVAALDIMAATNFVNYFGSSESVEQIEIAPLLIRKGHTRLAIYGLGYIRDERLVRLFARGKVRFLRPELEPDSWFNIFVLHQNRVARGGLLQNNLITLNLIPEFIQLILFGHEHKSDLADGLRIFDGDRPRAIQVGSTIATVLNQEESLDKYIGLLRVNGRTAHIEPIKLASQRMFVYRDITLSKESERFPIDKSEEGVEHFLNQYVEGCLKQAANDALNDKKPIVRVRVDYTGFPGCNPQRFGHRFAERVANPEKLVNLYQRRRNPDHLEQEGQDETNQVFSSDTDDMRSLMKAFLVEEGSVRLLPEQIFSDALARFVNDDSHALEKMVHETVKKAAEYVRVSLRSADAQGDNTSNVDTFIQRHTDLLATQYVPQSNKQGKESRDSESNSSMASKVQVKRKFGSLKMNTNDEEVIRGMKGSELKRGKSDVEMIGSEDAAVVDENLSRLDTGRDHIPNDDVVMIEDDGADELRVQSTLSGTRNGTSAMGAASTTARSRRRGYRRRT